MLHCAQHFFWSVNVCLVDRSHCVFPCLALLQTRHRSTTSEPRPSETMANLRDAPSISYRHGSNVINPTMIVASTLGGLALVAGVAVFAFVYKRHIQSDDVLTAEAHAWNSLIARSVVIPCPVAHEEPKMQAVQAVL